MRAPFQYSNGANVTKTLFFHHYAMSNGRRYVWRLVESNHIKSCVFSAALYQLS